MKMRLKNKILLVAVLLVTVISISIQSFALDYELQVKFNGKEITMESSTPEMAWDLENFLPGQTDTSSVTIKNSGSKPVTVETIINIEEDTGLLEMIDLTVKNNKNEVVFDGSYTDLKTISQNLKAKETQKLTVTTKMNVNAGNEYQNKQYKLNFKFKASGEDKYGTLTIRYVDENGKDLEPPTVETKNIVDEYNLSKNGKKFEGYRLDKIEGNLKGNYKEEGSEVIYHYKKVKYGNLIVKYVDENNKELSVVKTTKEVGTDYKLDKTGKKIDGYRLIDVEGELTGKYKEEDTIITYHYKKIVKSNVIEQYLDVDTGEIIEQINHPGEEGEPYDLGTPKEISGYTFNKTEGETKGKYKKEDIVVKHYYKKNSDKKTGRVIVNYVDPDGNPINPQKITTEEVGKDYKLSPTGPEFEGYEFVKVIGEYEGKYKEEDTVISYVYQKKSTGKVIVLYVDENGNEIERNENTSYVGNSYKYSEDEIKKDIDGYKFVSIEGELEGLYKKEDTIIYCRYKKNQVGRVIVVCIDENNNIIKRTINVDEVGNDYDLGKVGEKIEGYNFIGTDGETSGKYTAEDIIVTYRYEKIKAPTTEVVTLPKSGQFQYVYIILGSIIFILIIALVVNNKKDKKK